MSQMIESAFFYESLKSVAAKINSIAKEMDKKTNDFAEAVIGIFVDYDEEIFTRNGNEGDRADIKQAIINLFSTFAPEKKDKKLTGYNLYCQEARDDLVRRNPGIKAADVMAALGAEWKALDDDEKKEWNVKAAAKSPATEEEKAAKKSKSKKSSSAPKKTCDYAGCTKVVKDPSEHSDGCVYCASCLKKVVVAEKKASTPKCQHTDKEGNQCKANAINGDWCAKHMKKSSPSVKPVEEPKKKEKKEEKKEIEEKKVNKSESKKPEKKDKKESIKDELKAKVSAVEKKIEEAKKKASPVAKPVAAPVKKSGFDFSSEEPVAKNDEEYWQFKNAKAGKDEIRIHKKTGLVFKRNSDELFGLNKDGEMVALDEIDEEVKEWVRKCGWGNDEEDVEMDDDLDVDADQLESDEE